MWENSRIVVRACSVEFAVSAQRIYSDHEIVPNMMILAGKYWRYIQRRLVFKSN